MTTWLRVLAAMALPALIASAGSGPAPADAPRPLAVLFYADWCSNCKALEPKYEPAQRGFEDKIQFVRLDVTDPASKARAKILAYSLGIAPLYFSNEATGCVALLDAQRNKVGELHSEESEDEMRAALGSLAPGS